MNILYVSRAYVAVARACARTRELSRVLRGQAKLDPGSRKWIGWEVGTQLLCLLPTEPG